MTDRIRSLTVVLDRDTRTDDAQGLIDAISRMRGVDAVLQGDPVSPNDHVNRMVIRVELRKRLWDALEDDDA